MNKLFVPPSNHNGLDKTDPFKKPKGVSSEDWNLYLMAISASVCNMPIGSRVYDAYKRVNEILWPKKKRPMSNYKEFKSCINK